MPDIRKFKHREKRPTDPLLASDPMLDWLDQDARSIYLRIINEAEPGVLLQCDRMAVTLVANATAKALAGDNDTAFLYELLEMYKTILAPELGNEYVEQIMSKG